MNNKNRIGKYPSKHVVLISTNEAIFIRDAIANILTMNKPEECANTWPSINYHEVFNIFYKLAKEKQDETVSN